MARKSKEEKQTQENKETVQEQETQKTSEKTTQEPEKQKEEPKKEPVMYVGEPVVNEKFFLRPGQIFMEIPAYVKDKELREKFIPVSQVKNKQNQ